WAIAARLIEARSLDRFEPGKERFPHLVERARSGPEARAAGGRIAAAVALEQRPRLAHRHMLERQLGIASQTLDVVDRGAEQLGLEADVAVVERFLPAAGELGIGAAVVVDGRSGKACLRGGPGHVAAGGEVIEEAGFGFRGP